MDHSKTLKELETIPTNCKALEMRFVLANLNTGHQSPYVEDYFEDPLDLRSNFIKEGRLM